MLLYRRATTELPTLWKVGFSKTLPYKSIAHRLFQQVELQHVDGEVVIMLAFHVESTVEGTSALLCILC